MNCSGYTFKKKKPNRHLKHKQNKISKAFFANLDCMWGWLGELGVAAPPLTPPD